MPPVLQALLATTVTWGVTALGAALVFGTRKISRKLLDAMLAFAAGVMIFVVAEELIPEAKRGSPDIAAISLIVGFAVMMTLDVALG
jgi:ZIP family zinc transporter